MEFQFLPRPRRRTTLLATQLFVVLYSSSSSFIVFLNTAARSPPVEPQRTTTCVMLYFIVHWLLTTLAVSLTTTTTTVPPPSSPRILRQNNGDFCLVKRCPIGERHCMIGLQFTDEEKELLPTCMPLPSGVYAIELTENVLFEPTPKAVHLFSRGGNDSMVLFYWEMMTPFGTFDVKYLRSEYPGKLFRVLSAAEGIFLVRVPGEDREVSTIATSPTPVTTLPYPTTTSALPPTPIVVTSTPVLTLPSTTRSVLTSHTTDLTTSNRPSITTTTTTTTPVKASTSSVWTSETIPPLAGLTFCLAVLLVLYARRVGWWPVDWCCCVTRLRHRRLERRRIDHQVRRNEDIELTSSETSIATTASSSTIATEDACCHNEGFVNVSLEDD